MSMHDNYTYEVYVDPDLDAEKDSHGTGHGARGPVARTER